MFTKELQVEISKVIDGNNPMPQSTSNRRLGQAAHTDAHDQNIHPLPHSRRV
jgi:hypothetical protein